MLVETVAGLGIAINGVLEYEAASAADVRLAALELQKRGLTVENLELCE